VLGPDPFAATFAPSPESGTPCACPSTRSFTNVPRGSWPRISSRRSSHSWDTRISSRGMYGLYVLYGQKRLCGGSGRSALNQYDARAGTDHSPPPHRAYGVGQKGQEGHTGFAAWLGSAACVSWCRPGGIRTFLPTTAQGFGSTAGFCTYRQRRSKRGIWLYAGESGPCAFALALAAKSGVSPSLGSVSLFPV
jgi:hypothetical protein